ncbi:MAG TPA: SUMF1/EgtB/PvdO family nonheme iron enzyme [Gammaproteobacteria bacterium]|nr:SUMF1/EgtB/PvdO family nonheme iron enzyme [Gammaproteobacteria bacterium]
MSIPANEQLRAVVNDYYHGLVSLDGYRERRGRILEALAAPAKEAEPRVAKAAESTATQRPTPQAPRVPAPVVPKPAGETPRPAALPPNLRWALIGAGALVVLAGIGFAVLRGSRPAQVEVQTESSGPAQSLPPGAALLERFLDKNAWDQDSVLNLEAGWANALTEEQRQAAASSPTFARFSGVLLRRLREEEALADSGETPELERLARLATELKVPYVASSRQTPRSSGGAPARPDGATVSAPARDSAAVPEDAGVPGRPTGEAAAPAATVATEVRPAPAAPAAVPSPNPAAATAAQSSPAAVSGDGNAVPACSAELLSSRRRPVCSDPLQGGGAGPTLVIIAGGTFRMGSEQSRNAAPVHDVSVPGPLAVSVYETSFAEFERYCTGSGKRCPMNPWGDAAFPVVLVDWNEAVAYTEWLSAETGQRYRLPSESEWEYAARAGTQTPYPFGNDVTPSNARSSAISQVSSPIANTDRSVNRNQFQLLHMIGNVREWVADDWHPDYGGAPTDGAARLTPNAASHAVRGGSYADTALQLRSAARVPLDTGTQDKLTGFRVVRELAR